MGRSWLGVDLARSAPRVPGAGRIATTTVIMAMGLYLPVSPVASALGFVPLPPAYWPILGVTLLAYQGLTQFAKVLLRRRGWI